MFDAVDYSSFTLLRFNLSIFPYLPFVVPVVATANDATANADAGVIYRKR